MSKISTREVIKDLSNIVVDSQYANQIGLQLLNCKDQTSEEYEELCRLFANICADIEAELESIRKLIPND